MAIYIDHAAAQLADETAVNIISDNLRKFGANAENRHFASYAVRDALLGAVKDCVAKWHMPFDTNAVFFSSGSEIFRFLIDFLNTLEKGNIVANEAMHPAFLALLRRSKHEIRMVRFTAASELDDDDLAAKCDRSTRLFAHWHIQSETGLVADIDGIYKKVKNINPEVIFFADTIQSFGKMPLPCADIWSASSHKIGIPGAAALFYRKNRTYDFERIVFDYRHDKYLMSRPESALTISMMQYAQILADKHLEDNMHYLGLQKKFRLHLSCNVKPTFDIERVSPRILHISLAPYDGAVVAGLLSEQKIAVSPGSACTAEAKTPSVALKALHIPNPFSVLRLSFGPCNVEEEAETFGKTLSLVLERY